MWFDRKRRELVAEEPQHWPTERMIAEGHADYATLEDLEGLGDAVLADIAELCEVDQFAPDECIPCRAHVIYLERKKYAELAQSDQEEVEEYVPEERETPRLDALMQEAPVFEEPAPTVDRFAAKVKELNALVAELLEGPPIPPPNVTLSELAALTVGAEKWLKMIDAQGLELAPAQEQMKNEIERVIAKMRRNQ